MTPTRSTAATRGELSPTITAYLFGLLGVRAEALDLLSRSEAR